MRISGSTSHCDDDVLAGQRNAARGKDGARTSTSSRAGMRRSGPYSGFFPLRRGFRGDGLGVAILTASMRQLSSSQFGIVGVRFDFEIPGNLELPCN